MSHDSHNPANTLFPQLLDGFDVNVKNINWDDPKYNILYDTNDPVWNKVKRLGVEELTDGTIGGTGIFDGLMVAVEAHLLKEYKANRITGADYTQAYMALMQSSMAQAVSYVTASEQQFWASVAARVAAINGIVELENVKLKYEVLKIEAMKGKADYALTKQRLAIEDTNYAIAEYDLTNIKPATYAGLLLDNTGKGIANNTATYNLNTILPTQHAGMVIANATAQYNLDYIMVENYKGLQWDNATKKYNLENIMVATYNGLLIDNATKQYNLDKILVATYDGMLIANATAQYNLDYILVETWKGLKWDNATKQYNLENILVAQYEGMLIANATAQYNLDYILVETWKGLKWDNATKEYTLENILPEQKILIMEQGNVQRAHTMIDRRNADGTVSNVDTKSTVYLQNWLHWVQSSAFVRDTQIKAAKLFSEVYAVVRTTDDTIDPWPGISVPEAQAAFERLKDYMDINVSTGWNL